MLTNPLQLRQQLRFRGKLNLNAFNQLCSFYLARRDLMTGFLLQRFNLSRLHLAHSHQVDG